MGPSGVLECHPILNDAPGLESIGDFLKVDGLLLQGSPQAFNEDVFDVSSPSVHRDAHAHLVQRGDPGRSGELADLICIHDLRWALLGYGLLQCFDAEVCVHRVAELPAQDLARGPIQDGDQIQEHIRDRHKGDICTPNLNGPVNLHLPQKIRIDRMLGVRLAGPRPFVDRFQTYPGRQPPDAVTPNDRTFYSQIGDDLA